MRRSRPLVALMLGLLSACTSDDTAPPPATGDVPMTPMWTCMDQDGDSYGTGCRRGSDCDDTDPTVTVQCLCEGQKSPGCGCTEAGEQAGCGLVYSRVGSTVICGQGVTSCDGTRWGECIINNAVALDTSAEKRRSTGLRGLALGAATACDTNPCDPTCQTFNDTPDEDLPLEDSAGVVASPSGVTLISGETIVIPAVTGTGYSCTDASYPANGGCAHHPCRTGSALSADCDGSIASLDLFSDSFNDGNSQGWTLDSTWAIGSTSASSGHGSGNGDPSSDATSGTSDNRIGGTVLGGNIGGGSALFSDSFSNLSQWTETGEGDWTTQSRASSWGYDNISGNPVAHSDNCDTGCTITSPVINLSGQSSATLSFQWYMSDEMEWGEYLRADIYDGSSWTQIFNKSTTSDQDSRWHSETISIPSSHRVSGFRLRFSTQQSYSDEEVEVDDVQISVPGSAVTRSMTSPSFDTSASTGPVTLSFKRWLNVNADFVAKAEVYDGTSWVTLYTSSGAVSDNAWQSVSYDISAYKSSSTRIRFSYTGTSSTLVSGWNVDDVSVTGSAVASGSSLCVEKVCAARPECCTAEWSLECVELLDDVCQLECAIDTANDDACIACFNDPTLTIDVDGDGQSPATGDCRECDPGISAGAYDLPGNNIDENCDGTPDNEATSCDSGLSASGSAWDHAKSLGLCKVASGNSWGVVSASFVRADGSTACTDSMQYRIMSSFGSGNTPTAGSSMSVFSSGTARVPSDGGYIKPDGNGYDANTSSTPKYSVPAASGCNSGRAGYDSCGLKLVLRAPTNANSFGYNFNFFTSEYPEWLCTSYNDAYVAYYEGSLNTASNKNISFDSADNPVSVNNGLFTIPGWPPPSSGTHALLNGTGYDGVCWNNPGGTWFSSSICGGSTGWLQTTAPVRPGEEVTLIFNVWDTGDHQWDSTVLIDNFTWSTETASVATGHYVPSVPETVVPATYEEGWFVRDYDMSGGCPDGQVPVWSLWSWAASTPADSQIEFYVQAASSAAELAVAPRDALLFSDPPGPSTLAGTPAVARAGSPDTRSGSATVQDTLVTNERSRNASHLRISARLVPTSDLLQAPILTSWNLQTSCEVAQ